jgi:Intein splicing domain/DNA polymerase family B
MEFKLTSIDPQNCSIEELQDEIERLKAVKEEYFNLEQSIKIFINSIYGAAGSPWFEGYNVNLAEAVTLQGQDVAKYASKCIDEYFMEMWHKDKQLHEALGLTYVNKLTEKTLTIYMDTDSIHKDSYVTTISGMKTIEQWYNENKKLAGNTLLGHESVKTDDKILNWKNDKGLYYVNVKRIIRHKVTKSKWKIKTKSGKEIIVTNDHSIIVFRNNQQIEIKPKNILVGDKIICVK